MNKLCQCCSKRYLCKEVDTKEECNRFKSWIQTKNYGGVIAMNKSKLKVDIQKDFYHKTKNVNGVQKVDTDNKYDLYRVKIENQYFTEKKDELIKNMLEDIKELETALEKELEGEIERC